MNFTPQTIRQDLKCGKGSISQGEKCSKGTASSVTKSARKKKNEVINKALVVAGTALTAGGVLYGMSKFKKSKIAAGLAGDKKNTPEQTMSKGKEAFSHMRGVPLATELAGAGVGLAGIGITRYGVENKNQKAAVAGAALTYLGASTAFSGYRMRQGIKQAETEFTEQAQDYKKQYYSAQEAAKARQKAAGSGYTNSKTKPNASVPNPYKDLGVSETTPDAELKEKWKRLMRENHPDLGGDPRKAVQINAAYQEILRRRGRRDSIWADGFSLDIEDLYTRL